MMDLSERYTHYRGRFRAFMEARNLTNEAVAERIGGGVHPVTVSKLRTGTLDLDDEWRMRIASAFRIDHDVLFGSAPLPAPRPEEIRQPKRRGRRPARPGGEAMLPVYGFAAGALSDKEETVTGEPTGHTRAPPALAGVEGAYAVKVRANSMWPRYRPDETIYVDPRRQVKPGDHVVIRQQPYPGARAQTYVKLFATQDEETIWVAQYHPEARVAFRRSTVLFMHRVLDPDELF